MANKKIEYLHGEISPWLKEQIRNAAFDAHMTMGQWLNKTLHAHFNNSEPPSVKRMKPGPKPKAAEEPKKDGRGGPRLGAGRPPSTPTARLAQAGWTLDISNEGLPVLRKEGIEVFQVKPAKEKPNDA